MMRSFVTQTKLLGRLRQNTWNLLQTRPFPHTQVSRKHFSTPASSTQPVSAVSAYQQAKKFTFRLLKWSAGMLVVSGVIYSYFDEGVRRSGEFWLQVFPIYCHYRGVQLLNRDLGLMGDEYADELYESLHNKYAPRVRDITYKLRGFYLKDAQLCSTLDGFIPDQYMEWCKQTQDSAPTEFAEGQVRAIVEAELGRPISEVFEWWDDEPCGIASIGQVHRARLYGGREVVVKVQLPGIENRFRSDLATIKLFCQLAMPQHVPGLEEVEKQFMTEFDYVGEARNLQEVANNVLPTWGEHVAVPEPIMDLCTKFVLVMDYIPGIKLVDGIKAQYERYASSLGKTLVELEAEAKQRAQKKNESLQPRQIELPSGFQRTLRKYVFPALLHVSDVLKNIPIFFYNLTVGNIVGNKKEYYWAETPLDLSVILDLLLRVHAYEIFQNGAFNGDPHPGNILLMPDGRLGLIDYGQVKHMNIEERVNYAKLIIALANEDKDEVVRLSREEFRYKSKYMREDIMWKLTVFWHDRSGPDIVGDMNIQTFMDWCEEQDPVIEVPCETVMAARVSVLMRGMGNAFGLNLRTAPTWKPFAEQLLKEQGIVYPPLPASSSSSISSSTSKQDNTQTIAAAPQVA